jgi:hypothetical protein
VTRTGGPGSFPAGTILAAGDSISADNSKTKTDMYASTDHGVSWSFVSSIATGGDAVASNGHTPVWEPYFMVANNRLIAWISDQRDPAHGQRLAHFTTTDGVHWSSEVDDVTFSGKYLAVPGGSPSSGTGEIQWTSTGGAEQDWSVEPAPAGGYTITNRRSDLALTMATDANGQTSTNEQVTQAPLTSATNQRWNLLQTAPPDFTTGQYVMANVNSGKYAEVVGNVSGTQADQYRDVNHPDQYWTFTQVGSYYTITNVSTGNYLDSAGNTTSGSAVVEKPSSGSTSQQWSLIDSGNGAYQVVNRASGLSLAVAGASTDDAAPLDQETASTASSRLWTITKIN